MSRQPSRPRYGYEARYESARKPQVVEGQTKNLGDSSSSDRRLQPLYEILERFRELTQDYFIAMRYVRILLFYIDFVNIYGRLIELYDAKAQYG